jgi:serine/threonine protein kinase
MSDVPNALPPDTRLGEFKILGVIGVGGFGIVYRALDLDLEREVAIKEYMPGQFAGRDATGAVTVQALTHAETFGIGLRSFVNEARLLARFDHPALVKVHRYWEANNTAYMAMPFYEGRTLGQTLRGLPVPPDQAWLMQVLDPVLDALDLLHTRQIYHRDISPDNIMLLSSGAPVLLDFGAARQVLSDRTQMLTAILKPNYAPIEQYADVPGLKQGPWTDLYALGAVVYACLTGRPPSPAATRGVMDDLQPLLGLGERLHQQHGLTYSPAFLSTWQATLNIRPADRPQNVAELRAALAGQPLAARTAAPSVDADRTVIVPRASTATTAPAHPQEQDDRTVVITTTGQRTTTPPTTAAARTIAGSAPSSHDGPADRVAPDTRPGGSGRIGLAAAAVVLLAAGGWWVLRTPASAPAPAAGLAATSASAAAVAATSTAALPASAAASVASLGMPPQPAQTAPTPQAANNTASAPPSGTSARPAMGQSPGATAGTPATGLTSANRSAKQRPAPTESQVGGNAPSSGPAVDVAVHPAAVVGAPAAATTAPAGAVAPPPKELPAAVEKSTASGTATDQCGKRVLVAYFLCMRRECALPEFAGKEDCRTFQHQQEQATNRSGY